MAADQNELIRRLIEYQADNERMLVLLERCNTVLANMARENVGWGALFRRWYISHEPLRHDAKNLLPLLHAELFYDE